MNPSGYKRIALTVSGDPRALRGVAVVGRAHERDLAQTARLDHLPRFGDRRRAHHLAADLEHAPRLADDVDNLLALVDRVRERLLDVSVLPGLQRLDRHRLVPVIRRRDDDGVDVFAVQNLAVVANDRRPSIRPRPRPGRAPGIRVGDRDDLHPGQAHRVLQQLLAARTRSDESHRDAIVWFRLVGEAGARNGNSDACQHAVGHEFAAVHVMLLRLRYAARILRSRY